MRYLFIFFIITFCTLSCKKVLYYPDRTIDLWPTKEIAHRAGGNDTLRENTLPAASVALALSYIAGVETDVQISKSHTVWMSHNTKIVNCNGEQNCFFSNEDNIIEAVDSCNGHSIRYYKLEQLFHYMYINQIKKYVSIDLKAWTACGVNGLDIEGTLRYETELIIELGRKYGLEEYLMFESQTASVLNWIQKKSHKAQTYYLSFEDVERAMLVALENQFTGISYNSINQDKLSKEFIDLLHKKGLRFMAWNIQSEEQKAFLKNIGCDFIQIDL